MLAPRAAAAPVALSEGSLDWGFKESFRAYAGTGELGGGATANGDGTYHFELESGTRDDEAGALSAQFAGSVRYVAHCEFVPCALDMTIANPRVELGAGGAALYVDLTNYDFFGTGQTVASPDTRFATLETADGGTPPVAAGVAAWGDLTATLTAEGAAAFAGYYQPGQVLDPVSLTDGPPLVEEWTGPGAYFYEEAGSTPLSGVARWIAVDGANDEVWVLTGRQVSVIDAGTLAVKDSVMAAADTYGDVGLFDPTSRTAFFRSDPDQAADDTITAVSWDGAELSTEVLPGPFAGSVASPVWAYDAVAGRLIVSGGQRTVAYVRDGSGGWTHEAFGDKPCGTGSSSYSFNALLATSDGTVLARHLGGLFPLEFSAGAIQCGAEIPGTDPPARGVPQLAEDGEGNVHMVFASPGTPEDESPESGFDLVLAPKAGGGYGVDGAPRPFTGTPAPGQAVIDPDELSLYVGVTGAGNRAWAHWLDSDGKFHTLLLPGFTPAPAGAIGVVNWTVFASEVEGSGPSAQHSLVAYAEAGTTPSFSTQPQGVTETLSDEDPTATVSFTAAAGASPSPTLRWQTKAPGGTAWVDVPGATGGTLEVEVDRADDGREYRAVAANAGGEVPSAVAAVTIRTAPALTAQPGDLAVTAGEDATIRLHYTGNPAPEVQWQRKAGAFWTAIGEDEGDFEIVEGSLVVRDTRVEMSGVELRARIRNLLGTVYTRAVRLSVEAPPADAIAFGSGHADWGVKASFRGYIEGPIAHGSYTALEGAQRNADGTIRFEVIGGEADWSSGEGGLVLNGAVRFQGHDSGSGPLLELTVDDPRLEWGGGEAALYADVTSRSLSGGTVERFPGVELATVDLGDDPTPTAQGLAIGDAATTLTSAGAPAFGGFYAAGAALDPITALAIEGEPRADPPPAPPKRAAAERPPLAMPAPPAATPTRPGLAAPTRALALGRGGSAAIATVICPTGGPACTIEAPRAVRLKIAGETFRARVKAPKRIGAGAQARVRIQLPAAATEALAGRRVRVAFALSVRAGAEELETRLRAVLKRPAAA